MTILRPGASAPEFTLANQFGRPVSLSRLRDAASVTIVFFPLAFSRVCQGELRELHENADLFATARSELVAISVDSKRAPPMMFSQSVSGRSAMAYQARIFCSPS